MATLGQKNGITGYQGNWTFTGSVAGSATLSTTGNVTVGGLLLESAATALTAGTTRTQAGALVLTKEVNLVGTSTAPAVGTALGDGVVLMAAQPGLDVTIINNTANIIMVYGNGSDTVNGIAGATGVPIPPFCVEIFESPVAGAWYYDAGVGFAGALNTVLSVDGIIAAGTNQGTATTLVADFNRITSTPAGTGVILPAAKSGMDVIVLNHGGLPMKVFGTGTDTIDDVAAATGVTQMDRSVVLYTCYSTATGWYTEGLATGYSISGLQTVQSVDAVAAAGTSQATATATNSTVVTVSSVASGTGVNLPASSVGLQTTIINTGVNPLQVYAFQGSTDTINGAVAANGVSLFPGSTATFSCTAAGAWTVQPGTTKDAAFNTNAATTSATLTAANISGGVASSDLQLTGTLAGAANATLPTVASLVLALHSPTVGTGYRLRITNASAGAFAWTVLTNTGWTLAGTQTIAQNTWREYVVTLTSLTTASLQSVATGTYS